MPTAVENNSETGAVRVEGDMTIMDAAELKNALMDALAGTRDIALDLSAVGEMDSAGFQLLILAKREAEQRKRGFRIVSASSGVSSVLELYNMKTYFGL